MRGFIFVFFATAAVFVFGWTNQMSAGISKNADGGYEYIAGFTFSENPVLIRSAVPLRKEDFPTPHIAYLEPNAEYRAAFVPNDALLKFQDYLVQIQAYEAWDVTAGSSAITIAVLDTGVDIDNPDLRGNIWINRKEIAGNGKDDDKNGFVDDVYGWDFVDNTPDVYPKKKGEYTEIGLHHGTLVAGIAAARGGNREGISGISWRARIMPLRVLASDGVGRAYDVARGIDYAVANGADIINLSFVGNQYSQTLADAIERAYRSGVIVVAAAGNEVLDGIDIDQQPRYPVCHDGPNGENWVIGVAAVDKNDRKASFSNFGKKCIDVSAPGVGIFSTLYSDPNDPEFKNDYGGFWSGTSFAAPQVAGTLALMKSVSSEDNIFYLQNLLKLNTDDIESKNQPWPGKLGTGRLNVKESLYAAFGIGGKREIPLSSGTVSRKQIVVSFLKGKEGREAAVYSFSDMWGGGKTPLVFDRMEEGYFAAMNDIDNDGKEEIIAASGKGAKPWIRIYNNAGILQASWLAYAPSFKGGVRFSVGDVDGDNEKEIVTVPLSSGGPHVRVFSSAGQLEQQWFAFNRAWRGGLSVSVGDIDGIPGEEIAVSVDGKSTPEVRLFRYSGRLLGKFLAYHPSFLGGVRVAVFDIDLDGRGEIITAPGSGGGPHVRVFDASGKVEGQFFAGPEGYRGGIIATAGK